MRAEAVIQSTHDALVDVLNGKVDVGLNEHERSQMRCTVDALCWVLEHSHNNTLRNQLQTFHRAMKAADRTFAEGATPPAIEKGGK